MREASGSAALLTALGVVLVGVATAVSLLGRAEEEEEGVGWDLMTSLKATVWIFSSKSSSPSVPGRTYTARVTGDSKVEQ